MNSENTTARNLSMIESHTDNPANAEAIDQASRFFDRWVVAWHRNDWWIFGLFLACYAVIGALIVSFYPSYGWPDGDEATYYSYAENPWTLTSDFFEGFKPKEVVNPYNFRLFLAPFSAVFAVFGFTVVGARLCVLAYGVFLLAVCYALARRLAPVPIAFGTIVAFSLSPIMLYATHVVRPEGMMALWLLLGIWLLARRDSPCSRTVCFVVGILAASALWIHYHGIVFPGLVLVGWLFYDDADDRSAKLLAYVAGVAVVAAFYALLNLWPARETIAEFGWLPVTFASSNRVPLLEPPHLFEGARRSATYYLGVLAGGDRLGELAAWCTVPILLASVGGFFAPGGGLVRMLRAILLGLLACYLVIFPNARWEYLLYLYPLLLLFAVHGFAQLPRGRDMALLTGVTLTLVGAGYLVQSARLVAAAWQSHAANQETGELLRETVGDIRTDEPILVMAPQEFHRFVPDTEFRTFHSLIGERNFVAMLQQFRPHVVGLTERGMTAIAVFLNDRLIVGDQVNLSEETGRHWFQHRLLIRDPDTGRWKLDLNRVESYVRSCLSAEGYVRVTPLGRYEWDDAPALIYVRSDLALENNSATEPRDICTDPSLRRVRYGGRGRGVSLNDVAAYFMRPRSTLPK